MIERTLEAGWKLRIGPCAYVARDIPNGELVLLKLSLPVYCVINPLLVLFEHVFLPFIEFFKGILLLQRKST